MNLSRLALVGMAIALFTVACSKTDHVTNVTPQPTRATSPVATATPDEFAATRATYAKRCAVCHGDTGEGKTAEIEGKKIKAPSLRTGHALKHSDADFVKQITKGGDGMPAFADKLSKQEIDDMVRFIRHDFQGGNSPQMSPMKMK
jgi:mono/diheme cytochrome c family protein